MGSGLEEGFGDHIIFGFEFLDSFMAVVDAGILFEFVVELFHDLVVHVLNLFFELEDLVLDWEEVVFELVELKLVNVLDFFHFIGGFKVLNKLGLLFFNSKFLFFEFLDETIFFVFV